jgi:uncharacterized protein
MAGLEEVTLGVDEFEAIRLADLEGLHQDAAAAEMDVSRQTFGRIIDEARRKVAEALVKGKALRIDGGEFQIEETRRFECERCGCAWELPRGTGRPERCPSCDNVSVYRADSRHGSSQRCGKGRGGGCGRNGQG